MRPVYNCFLNKQRQLPTLLHLSSPLTPPTPSLFPRYTLKMFLWAEDPICKVVVKKDLCSKEGILKCYIYLLLKIKSMSQSTQI